MRVRSAGSRVKTAADVHAVKGVRRVLVEGEALRVTCTLQHYIRWGHLRTLGRSGFSPRTVRNSEKAERRSAGIA